MQGSWTLGMEQFTQFTIGLMIWLWLLENERDII